MINLLRALMEKEDSMQVQMGNVSREMETLRKPQKETLEIKNTVTGTCLVGQRLRIHLPKQGTWVQALVQEDLICRGATKPVRHNY